MTTKHPGLTVHPKTKMYVYRRRVPKDLQASLRRSEYKVFLGTRNKTEALLLYAKTHRETNERWAAIRSRPTNGYHYTKRDANAIAGEIYRIFINKHRNNPDSPQRYANSWLKYAYVYACGNQPDVFPMYTYMIVQHGKEIAEVERRYGFVRARNREIMFYAVARSLAYANAYMHILALGDTPTERQSEFPPLLVKINRFEIVFDEFIAKKRLSQNTRKRWLPALRLLIKYVGHDDLGLITKADVVAWVADLESSGRDPRTVRDVHLASAKSLFGWMEGRLMIKENPASGVRVDVPEKVTDRPTKGLTTEEAILILSATLVPPDPALDPLEAAARRWIPWLCAYSGARVNELTQLRRCDILRRDGVDVMRIRPSAGTTKNKKARDVPLHSHLIEQGFLAFVADSVDGPLFHPGESVAEGATPRNQRLGARLGRWVRSLGVDDPEVRPNHGWRHRFNTTARRVKMDREKRDAIKGHAPATDGEWYGDFEADDLSDEIEKLPRYKVAFEQLNQLKPKHGAELVAAAVSGWRRSAA